VDTARHTVRRSALGAVVLGVLLLAGCGSESGPKAPPGASQNQFERQLAQASSVSAADFPAAGGRTLQQIADTATPGSQLGLATSVLGPGTNRLAFGVLDQAKRFLYGKTGVYVAPKPNAKAQGPYPAPADALVTKPQYRSRTAASEKDPIAAIYAAQVPFKKTGRYAVLVLTKQGTRLVGATAEVDVKPNSPIPAVGERPPAVNTDTLASAGGDIAAIDTRVPPAKELHQVNFKDVIGKKPVALLFATPQLCQSRVCGPVVDIELQLKQQYGERVAFIHQEVYNNNQVDKGLRTPLRAFNLQTEPWLFTFDRSGRVAARLEGSFGVNAFKQAVDQALQ